MHKWQLVGVWTAVLIVVHLWTFLMYQSFDRLNLLKCHETSQSTDHERLSFLAFAYNHTCLHVHTCRHRISWITWTMPYFSKSEAGCLPRLTFSLFAISGTCSIWMLNRLSRSCKFQHTLQAQCCSPINSSAWTKSRRCELLTGGLLHRSPWYIGRQACPFNMESYPINYIQSPDIGRKINHFNGMLQYDALFALVIQCTHDIPWSLYIISLYDIVSNCFGALK